MLLPTYYQIYMIFILSGASEDHNLCSMEKLVIFIREIWIRTDDTRQNKSPTALNFILRFSLFGNSVKD